MLEDMSTNGTWVDDKHLQAGSELGQKRVLSPGSIIYLCPGKPDELIRFVVRIPRESGRGFKPITPPDNPPAMSPQPRFASPNVSLPRIGDIQPGVVQSPQQRNAAAILRSPIANRPQERHRRQADGRDTHTMQEPSNSMTWGGDHKYMLSSQIGKGAFATVNKAYERSNGEVVAVKSIAKRTFATQAGRDNVGVKKEIAILEALKHPNIVEYVGYFEDSSHIYVVMEFIEYGDLNNYLNIHGPMPEPLTKIAVTQVLHGLKYIHNKGISHRDLKPDNILIASEDPFVVKISDFGLAKMVNNEETFLKTFCGTMLYLAPEVFPSYLSTVMADAQGLDGNTKRKRLPGDDAGPIGRRSSGKKPRRRYNQAVDMWSLGCVIYCLLCGHPPFEGKNQDDMYYLVSRGEFDEVKLRQQVGADNEACVDFLHRLLQVRPEIRLTETEALRHSWIYRGGGNGSASMEYDEDEVVGVDYGLRPQRNKKIDESGSESAPDPENEDEGGLPAPCPDKNVDAELQGSMARVSFSQIEDNFDLQSSGETSSGNECFESLVNSRQEFSQEQTGISVIDRARRYSRYDDSFEARRNSIADDEQGADNEPSVQHLGQAFEYRTGQCLTDRQHQFTGGQPKFDRLGFDDVEGSGPYSTPPPGPSKAGNGTSPWSFAGHAHFNLSPESLKTASLKQAPPAPKPTPGIFMEQHIVRSEDDDLPSTQSVIPQAPPAFRAPPVSWGRLVPLPGSLTNEPITLIEQMVSFGRASRCTIKPDDIRISKFHFALQLNYPDDRQTNPSESRVGEWGPAPNMIAIFHVLARCGVFVNGQRYNGKSQGRLYDGDEIILFKEKHEEKHEFMGYKVELTVGDVKRNGPPLSTIHYNFASGHNTSHNVHDRSDSSAYTEVPTVAYTEVPTGQSDDANV